MHGNAWEWCEDRYGDYPKGTVTDPKGPAIGDRCVFRGGAFCDSKSATRSSYRIQEKANSGYSTSSPGSVWQGRSKYCVPNLLLVT